MPLIRTFVLKIQSTLEASPDLGLKFHIGVSFYKSFSEMTEVTETVLMVPIMPVTLKYDTVYWLQRWLISRYLKILKIM